MVGIMSFRSSAKYVDCHKVKEQFVQIVIPYKKYYSSSLRRMVDEELIVCQL